MHPPVCCCGLNLPASPRHVASRSNSRVRSRGRSDRSRGRGRSRSNTRFDSYAHGLATPSSDPRRSINMDQLRKSYRSNRNSRSVSNHHRRSRRSRTSRRSKSPSSIGESSSAGSSGSGSGKSDTTVATSTTDSYDTNPLSRSTLTRAEYAGHVKFINEEITWKRANQMITDTEAALLPLRRWGASPPSRCGALKFTSG